MTQFDAGEILLGWKPADAASRALQAVHGLTCFSIGTRGDSFVRPFTEDTLACLERIPSLTDVENLAIVERNRDGFDRILAKAKLPFFSAASPRLWRLFMERYDFFACKLRANLEDVLECFDLAQLCKIFAQPPSYFRRLPPSSELVLGPWAEGLRVDLVIPPRLLVLDMILMLEHARYEHTKLEVSVSLEGGVVQLRASGRLDSYARQTIILATSVLDNVLTDYGNAVVAALEAAAAEPAIIARTKALQDKGVTARLRTAPQVWCECLGKPARTPGDFLGDMLTLVEIRNRLVHPDGRVNCWYAFQLDPMRATGWHLSARFHAYLEKRVRYRIPQSNIGYELSLAHFCVDTVLLTIDYVHNILFPDEPSARWLNLPRTADGVLDIDATVENEHVLKLSPG